MKPQVRMTSVFWGALVLIGLVALIYWAIVWHFQVYTNDAYVEGNQIFLTPLKRGFVTAIHTDDTFLVEKGQLLVELDETDARIALSQAENELANTVREVCQLFHQLFAARADIQTRQAELLRAAQDYQHRKGVLAAEGVSLEDFEHAFAALRSQYFSLKRAYSLYNQTLSLLQGTSIVHHPRIQAASERLRTEWVQLYRCKIYAPAEGLVAQRKIQVGMWVDPGQPLLSILPLDQIWVNANYKETQLREMRIGQSVRLHSDLYGREVLFHGKVVGLPGGAGNIFSLLPPQNLSGNWIKIVQRLPVRVALHPDELRQHPLRYGLSMEAIVNLRNQEGPLVPDSPLGSPTYATTIFEQEEWGDARRIAEIIQCNLDPTLSEYETHVFDIEELKTDPQLLEYVSSIGLEEAP